MTNVNQDRTIEKKRGSTIEIGFTRLKAFQRQLNALSDKTMYTLSKTDVDKAVSELVSDTLIQKNV
jgi:hypothetical protein